MLKWVPELRGLAKKHLHKPWEAPAEALQAAGIQLGSSYPHRIETERLEVRLLAGSCLICGASACTAGTGWHGQHSAWHVINKTAAELAH